MKRTVNITKITANKFVFSHILGNIKIQLKSLCLQCCDSVQESPKATGMPRVKLFFRSAVARHVFI